MHEARVLSEGTGSHTTGAICRHAEVPVFAAGFIVEMPGEMSLATRNAIA